MLSHKQDYPAICPGKIAEGAATEWPESAGSAYSA